MGDLSHFFENFVKNSQKEYFVFTDAQSLYKETSCPYIHKVFQENLGWPDNTLKRFHMFNRIKEQLSCFDYIIFFNANCLCISEVKEEDFLPKKNENFVFCKHAGFYNAKSFLYPYERKKNSSAYIKRGQGKYYVQGALIGGRATSFIKMSEELMNNINKDFENNIIAKWHDESHLNHFIINRTDFRILPPSFLYPENWKIPFEKKIQLSDKNKFLNTGYIKKQNKLYIFTNPLRNFGRKVLQRLHLI